MRRLTLGFILAGSMLATPALARDDSWYVEADGGAVFVNKAKFDLDHASTALALGSGARVATLDSATGYDFGGIAGYDFGLFRLEGEASYRRANANTLLVASGPASPATFAATAAKGKASALSFMVNALVDLGPDDGPQLFAGGGIGLSHAQIGASANPNAATAFDVTGADDGLAWQALAGIRYPLGDKVDIGLKYRYFNQGGIDLPATYALAGPPALTRSDTVRTALRSHSALLTLTYNFTPPPPEPVVAEVVSPEAPPPEPAPPAPPAPPVCSKGPYIVFFDWDKADITPEAATILDSAVTAYGNCTSVPIMLAGYADRSGKPGYNQGLSERRNASVTQYLTAHGVPAGAISSQGFGESNNRVPTADGVRELQNRRVEITYGPGSGN